MSRRKQARPRLIKREDGEEETGEEVVIESEPDNKKIKLEPSPIEDDEGATTNGDHGNSVPTEKDADGQAAVKTEIFRCESCDVTFSNLLRFMDHKNQQCDQGACSRDVRSRSNTPSSMDSRGSNGSPLPDISTDEIPCGTAVSDDYPISCEHCDKTFSKTSFLHVHEQVHRDKLPHGCGGCARVFKTKRQRDRHAKSSHGSNGRRFKCPQCPAAFWRSESLKTHTKSHEIQEIYPCQICDLEYPTMAALMSHQNAHKPKPGFYRDLKAETAYSDVTSVFFTDKDREEQMRPGSAGGNGNGKMTFHCQHCAAICVGPTAYALHCEQMHAGSGPDRNKCPLCFKTFLSIDELTVHTKIHEVDIPSSDQSKDLMLTSADFQNIEFSSNMLASTNGLCPSDVLICPYCFRDDFETIEGLELHMQSVHSVKPTEVYTCNYCNAPYKNLYSLHEHMRAIHQNQPSMGIKYPCSRCGKEYPSIETLQEHKKRMHYRHKHTDNSNNVCSQCPLAFVSPAALLDHVKTAHCDNNTKRLEDRGRLKSPKLPPPKSTRPSLTIPKPKEAMTHNVLESRTIINVPEPSHILRHLRSPVKTSRSPPSTSPHGVSFTSGSHVVTSPISTPSIGQTESNQENITCDQCNATFTDIATYQAHVKLHIDSVVGQFGCRQCQKMFVTEEQLENHLSMHFLSSSSEYGCKSCDKTFSKPDELQKHLMDIHAHHLYKCSLCKEVYDSKVNIQVHFAIKHSDECKLYRCMVCDVMYRSEAEWQLHIRVKHLHLAKPYRCLFCKESFSSEMDLQCHLATHNKPFKCSMCDETFLVEFLLDKHLQHVHAACLGGDDSSMTSSVRRSTKVKEERDMDVAITHAMKSEPETSTMLFNPAPSPAAGPQTADTPGTILAGSVGILGGENLSGVPGSTGSFLEDGSSSLFQSRLSSSSSASGSLVWKSPEDLYRCNICDMKFSQLTGLQNHKLHDHGLKFVIPGKYSPATSPKQSTSTNGDNVSSVYNDILYSQASEPASPMVAEKQSTSLLQDALTSSFGLAITMGTDAISNNAFSDKLASTYGDNGFLACRFCSQTFKCKADLEKHSKIHLNTGSQKCNICDEVFATSGILAEHKLTHCKIQQGNVCVACKVSIKTEEQFYLHSQEHGFQGAVMQCIVCRQTLASMLELQMHGRHHFQTKNAFHTCCVCLNSFESNENLISKLNSSGRTYYVCKPCYHGEMTEYACTQCGAKFTSASSLEVHLATHKKSYQCIKCQESFSSEQEIQIHVATHMMTEGNVHECFLCFVILDSPAKLQCHLIEHTYKNADYRCYVCGRSFDSAVEIQSHALEHGVSARKHACDQCNQKFFFSAELENHVYIHKRMLAPSSSTIKVPLSQSLTIQPLGISLGDMSSLDQSYYDAMLTSQSRTSLQTEGEYPCSRCDNNFTSVFDLAEHFKTCHVALEKTFHKCPSCAETFTSVTQLQAHFFTVHTKFEPAEKVKTKYGCTECDKECSSEHNLMTHMTTHRKGGRHACPQCGKTFSTTASLSVHLSSKCHGVPHECPVCHKRFTKKTAKMEHMKSHSGDKVYPCSVCATLFTNKTKLEQHMTEHVKVPGSSSTPVIPDEDAVTETRSGTSEETPTSETGNQSDDDVISKELSDGENGGMKPEVTSTCNIPDETSVVEGKKLA